MFWPFSLFRTRTDAEAPARTLWMIALHAVVTFVSLPPLLSLFIPDATGWWSTLMPGPAMRAYLFSLAVVVSVLLCIQWTRPALIRMAPTIYWPFVATLCLLAVLLHVLGIPTRERHMVVLAASVALPFITYFFRRTSGKDDARASDVLLGLTACVVTFLSAEDYFGFQADRYLTLVLLAMVGIGLLCFWWLDVRWENKRLWNGLGIVLLFIVPFLQEGRWDIYHYGIFLGPVQELLRGGRSPFYDLHAFYGTGLTVFLAGYFSLLGTVSAEGLLLLQKVLNGLSAIALYVILSSLWKDRRLAFLATVAAFAFYIGFLGAISYETPSNGVLRTGWMLPILLLLTLAYERPLLRARVDTVVAVLCAIAAFWSSDNVLYTVCPTCALFVLQRDWPRAIRFFLTFSGAIVIVFLGLTLPAFIAHGSIDLGIYTEYQRAELSGHAGSPVALRDLFWFLPASVALFFVVRRLDRDDQDERLTLLALWCLALLPYFVWRGHWRSLPSFSLPFVPLFISYARVSLGNATRWFSAIVCTLFLSSLYFPAAQFLSGATPVFATQDDLRMLIPDARTPWRSDGFRERRCDTEVMALIPYVETGGIALFMDRHDMYSIYECLGTVNAFNVNPTQEMEFPGVRQTLFAQIRDADTRYVLVGDNAVEFVQQPADRLSPIIGMRSMRTFSPIQLWSFIDTLELKRVTSLTVWGEPVTVYERL